MIPAGSALVYIGQVLGLALLAALGAAIAAWFYRSRFQAKLPEAAGLIIGLGLVAIVLNTRVLFVQFVGDEGAPLALADALGDLMIFGVAAMATFAGHSTGDRIGQSARLTIPGMQPSLTPIVRATGRYITVTLPEEIHDIEGYDPVSSDVKERLAGVELTFPRGLTVEALQTQVTDRLTEKHDIGYVDVELNSDGTVTYLAVGDRPAGLGPTLPPGMAAVAVRGDPAFSASPGDTIELWDPDGPTAVGTAELRATVGDVTTIACDAGLCDQLDPQTSYRLVTLSGDSQPDREFAANLRHSLETMGVLDVDADSVVTGIAIGGLDVMVIAIQRSDQVLTIPDPKEVITAGDRLFVLGRPDHLRTLEGISGVRAVSISQLEDGAARVRKNGETLGPSPD